MTEDTTEGMQDRDKVIAKGILFYLMVMGFTSVLFLIYIFPNTQSSTKPFGDSITNDQGLILIAMLAGTIGSFIPAVQSLVAFVGNETFKASWTFWYLMRPWIGAVLGIALYFVYRAVLLREGEKVNYFTVAVLCILGGWFSKIAIDKMRDVFVALLNSDADEERKDKLKQEKKGSEPKQPIIKSIAPTEMPVGEMTVSITGENFSKDSKLFLNGNEIPFVKFESATLLTYEFPQRFPVGTPIKISVVNQKDDKKLSSNEVELTFA